MNMPMCCAKVCVCGCRQLGRPETQDAPGAGVTISCELPDVGAGN